MWFLALAAFVFAVCVLAFLRGASIVAATDAHVVVTARPVTEPR